MYVDPGELSKKITIIQRTRAEQDADGFDTEETVTVIRECWAKVTNTSGRELVQGGRELSDAKKRFLVRDNGTAITTNMIIQYAGHEYDIQYVNSYSEDREYLEIWTEWRAAA